MSLGYAVEKFTDAVFTLATSTSDLPARLGEAYRAGAVDARPTEDIPDDLRSRIEGLYQRMTREAPEAREGTVVATVTKMSATEAAEAAREVVSLALALRQARDEGQRR